MVTSRLTSRAVRIANDSPYGLVGYVWSQDIDTAFRVRDGLGTGTVWINTPLRRESRAPFGGRKDSGPGRSGRGPAGDETD